MATRSCRLTRLSAELQTLIIELFLPDNVSDLRSWSRTCSFYRSLLAPHIFKAIHLVNSIKSGLSVDAVARGPIRHCVQVLHYRGLASDDPDDQCSTTEYVFPHIVGRVLSNLQRFPNLLTVTFEFPFDWANWVDGLDLFDEPELSGNVQAAEESEGWRSLMLKSFDALSQGAASSVVNFEIRRLVAKEVSSFNSADFHHFLGTLNRFSVSLREWNNGAGWEMNAHLGFAPFAERLGDYFFDHLQSTTDFALRANESAPLGLDPGRYHVHLALDPHHLPLLRKLELRYIYVCPELTDFLVAHLETLEVLVMTDCLCSLQLLDEDTEGMRWEALFNAVSEGPPRRLRRLEVISTEDIGEGILGRCDEDRVKEMRKGLADDPKKRLFAYANLDDKYGMVLEDYDEELDSMLNGDDQRAYDRLIAMVEENRQKGGEAETNASSV